MRCEGMVWLVLAAVAAVVTQGCAVVTTPMPEVNGRLALKVSSEQLSSRPFGVYQIPDTSVYVSGHQGGADIGMVFGPIGLLAGHAAARSTGERKTKDAEAQLRLDLPKLTEDALAERLAGQAGNRFASASDTAVGTLDIKPYLVVNFIGNDRAQLWFVLRTILKGSSHKWKTQYIAGIGEPRPVGGANGWTADDGAILRALVRRNLRLAADALWKDASGLLRRDHGRIANITTHWLWLKTPRERRARVLDETDTTLVVLPCAYEKDADAFGFTGVTILDKHAVSQQSESNAEQSCLGKYLDVNPE